MKHFLVTGAHGFVGQNLILAIGRVSGLELTSVDIDTPEELLQEGLDRCDAVYHLAGVNRPIKEGEFESGNVGALAGVLSGLEMRKRTPRIILSSSTQAVLDNPYGGSKKRAEELLIEYCRRTGASACIFRLPGVFGKWSRPNYNSVVATFCHNIARGIPIEISDPMKEIELVHVDDVVTAFLKAFESLEKGAFFCEVQPVFRIRLGELASRLQDFHNSREALRASDLSDPFDRRLFGTYMSYLPPERFASEMEKKSDARGLLAEIQKAGGHGQFFVSRTKPGVVRGNHYHDRKVEKFLVLEGRGLIRFRNLATDERTEYVVSGDEWRMIDIPPGWTHSIQNVGSTEMITLFWASEVFDPDCPDTYPAEV